MIVTERPPCAAVVIQTAPDTPGCAAQARDSSPNQHATRHVWSTRSPIVRSLAPGESWRGCYVDEITA